MVAGTSFIIAASSILALVLGAPVPRNHAEAVRSLVERAVSYTVFSGDGSTAQGWPDQSAWLPFTECWYVGSVPPNLYILIRLRALNLPTIQKSCGQFNVPENNADEIEAIKNGLVSVAGTSQVDSRYLLAVMMQESKGCVRAPTTNYGVRNPGLFQDFNGEASCNDGTVINPCPPATITKMIEEGAGVGMEVGLSIGIAATGVSDVSKYYKAARIYNSGSVDSSGNLGAGIATHCYASDIANRLLGWVDGGSSCSESSIGSMTGSTRYAPSDSTSNPVDSTTPTATVIPVASSTPTPSATVVPSAVPEIAAPVDATPVTPVESNSPSSPFPGAASGCKSWYKVKTGDNCMSTGVDVATLAKLNNGLDSTCSNLWLGYSYCTAV
jgi:hypothetical protein